MNLQYIILIYIVVLCVSPKRYLSVIPTIPIYQSNNLEITRVKKYTQTITEFYKELFFKTDRSVSDAFHEIVPESLQDLDRMITHPIVTIPVYVLKYSINRARPKQMDSSLSVLNSNTANTPAYPSGHAYQSYYLAKILSRKYPHLETPLWKLADDCALSRVYAGLHYPSDNEFSKNLVEILYS